MAEQPKEGIVGSLGAFRDLRGKFNDELAQAIASGDLAKAQILKSQLQGGLEQLKKELDPYQLKLRKELAKDGGFMYVGMFGEEGLARAQILDREWTFIDRSGDPLKIGGEQKTFSLAYQFKEGRSVVRDDDGIRFLLPDGSFLGRQTYASANNFSEGLAAVQYQMSNTWNFIDHEGGTAFFENFSEVGNFSSGLARVKAAGRGADYWIYINKNGERQFEDRSFRRATDFSQGYAFVYCNPTDIDTYARSRTPGFFIMGKDGRIDLDKGFEEAKKFSEGQAPVYGNGSWYYIGHPSSPYTSARGTYNSATPFSEGLAGVTIDNNYLYINQRGSRDFELEYTHSFIASPFQEGVAKISFAGRAVYIDHKGKEVKEFGNG